MPQVPLTTDDPFGRALEDLLRTWGVELWPSSSGDAILVQQATRHFDDYVHPFLHNIIDDRDHG